MDIKNTDSTSIEVSPSFGATASFTSLSESMTYGDNHSQRSLRGINSLKMSLNLTFNELTEIENQKLISFLQSHFYYELQNYNTAGYFDNKRLTPFSYQPFFPYKEAMFQCVEFNQNRNYYNANTVQAKLEAIAPSILNSVESGPNHNPIIDGTIDLVEDGVSSVRGNDLNLPAGSIIYHSGDYRNAAINSDFDVAKDNSQALNISAPFGFPNSTISSNQTPLRNSIYINDPNDCFYYPYTPIHEDGNLSVRMFDFRPSESVSLSNSPKYRRSTVDDMYVKFNKYGFNPNLMNLNLSFNGRSNLEAKRILLFLEAHLGYKKFGFHLLRDYVGSNSDTIHTSPHRKSMSFYYCPEWTHTFTYKDNHNISATFIECIDY